MGIEVLSPADALFAPLTGAAPTGGAPAASESVPGGAFAALLAMLAGDGAKDGETADLLLSAALSLPGETAEGEKDGEATGGELAAAMALLLAPAPAITTPAQAATEAPPTGGDTESATRGTTLAQSVATARAPEVPATAATEGPAPELEAEAAAHVAVMPEQAPEGSPVPVRTASAQVASPVPPANAAPAVSVTEAPVTPAAVTAAQAKGISPGPGPAGTTNDGEEPPPVEGTADGPPTEAAPPAKEDTKNRVVRFVGNAETANENGIAHRRQPEVSPAKGTPKASAEAIVHAAGNSAVAELRTMDTSPTGGVDAPQAPAPAEPPAPMEQVGQAVIERAEQGGGEATITLDPVELGEVRIHVRIDGDAVSVDVQTERPEAMRLLREGALDLSSLLGERGLDLADVFVGMGQGRFQREAAGDANPNRRDDAGNDFAELLGLDAEQATRQHNRLRDAYNPDGTHVYRV